MALVERLAVLITADASQAVGELNKMAAASTASMGKVEGGAVRVGQGMQKVGAGMIGVGAGLVAVGVMAANSTVDLGREVLKVQRYTGLNAEAASKLRYAAKMSGVEVDTLAKSLGLVSKNMANSPAKFEALGIATKNAGGEMRPLDEVLGDVAARFETMPNGAQKNAEALALFGRSGIDMLPLLNKGRDGIAELSAEAEKMGVVLTDANMTSIKDNIRAQRELGAAVDGLKTKIGLQMIPVLTGFSNVMAGIPGPVLDIIGPLVTFGGLGLVVAGAATMIVGKVVEISGALISGAKYAVDYVAKMGLMNAVSFGVGVAALALLVKSVLDSKAAAKEAAEAWGGGSGSLDQRIEAAREQLEIWEGIVSTGSSLDLGFAEIWSTSDQADNADRRDAMRDLVGDLEEQKRASLETQVASQDLGAAQQGVTEATEGHAIAAKNLNDTLRAAFDPFFGAIDSNTKLEEASRKSTEAAHAQFWAQVALTEAQRQHGAQSPEAVAAQQAVDAATRDLEAALLDETRAAIDNEGAMAILAGQLRDNPALLQQNIDKINGMAASGAISAEAAARMRDRLAEVATRAGLVPATINTTIYANTAPAETSVRGLLAWAGTQSATVSLYSRGIGLPGTAVGGRVGLGGLASGGRLEGAAMGNRRGGPRLVGELGPEIFWPDSAGTIIPNNVASRSSGSAGGSGGSTYHITVNTDGTADGAVVGQRIVEAISEYERRNGSSWRG